jgi:hypothetical protein
VPPGVIQVAFIGNKKIGGKDEQIRNSLTNLTTLDLLGTVINNLVTQTKPNSFSQPAVISPDGKTVTIANGGHLILIPVNE